MISSPILNGGFEYREKLRRDADGSTVLAWLAARYRHSTEPVWRGRIERGEVRLDGQVAAAGAAMRMGQCLFAEENMMARIEVATGVVHKVPADLRKALISNSDVLEKWNSLTPLARNEWICWTTIVKKPETRREHIDRLCEDLIGGKRRPCCWPGCPHRNANAKKWFRGA